MDQETNSATGMPLMLSTCYLVGFLAVGFVAPKFAADIRSIEGELPWPQSILGMIHWQWILPTGCLVALLVAKASGTLSEHNRAWFDIVASVVLLIVVTGMLYLCLSFVHNDIEHLGSGLQTEQEGTG